MADHSLTDAAHDLLPRVRDFGRLPGVTPDLRVQAGVFAERLDVLLAGPAPTLPKRPVSLAYCGECGLTTSHWADCPEASS